MQEVGHLCIDYGFGRHQNLWILLLSKTRNMWYPLAITREHHSHQISQIFIQERRWVYTGQEMAFFMKRSPWDPWTSRCISVSMTLPRRAARSLTLWSTMEGFCNRNVEEDTNVVNMLKYCANPKGLCKGMAIHLEILKTRLLERNVFISSRHVWQMWCISESTRSLHPVVI